MAFDLRKLIESDLQYTLEGDYGLPITLIDPDGNEQEVMGQVLYETHEFEGENVEIVIVEKPHVTVRRSSLNRIPQPNETWAVKIPKTPDRDAETVTYLFDTPSEGGKSIGFIRLTLTKAVSG